MCVRVYKSQFNDVPDFSVYDVVLGRTRRVSLIDQTACLMTYVGTCELH